jgi:hypothetical protein
MQQINPYKPLLLKYAKLCRMYKQSKPIAFRKMIQRSGLYVLDDVFSGDYRRLARLSEGTFAAIYDAFRQTPHSPEKDAAFEYYKTASSTRLFLRNNYPKVLQTRAYRPPNPFNGDLVQFVPGSKHFYRPVRRRRPEDKWKI